MPRHKPASPAAASRKNEATTRRELIDPALKAAGWDVDDPSQVGIEIPVDGQDAAAVQAVLAKLRSIPNARQLLETPLPPGISDYALYRPNGEIIAVVEAKKTSIDPRLAQAQAEFYVNEIAKRQSFRPFAFMTNGEEIYFLDAGQANKRSVAGFFSPGDLENLLYLREHRAPLAGAPINPAIADRSYQHEAIRRVCEAFDQGKRRALLVMATGTGKTRTAMALIDLFLRTDQARRVLFVADRDVLVQQALDEGFKIHLPAEPSTRIIGGKLDAARSSRLYVVTLQTLNMCFQQFTPAFFDLIVFDEVHRSIFNKWSEVFQYFDARMVGLTATPADFIERNTFLTFECDNNTPTFLYSYRHAVDEGYLVDYSLYAAQTNFQRRGIKGVDLSEEERAALIEQGLDPDELDFSGTDLERRVSNTDTLRRQWTEIWEQALRDESGQLPGKTIVFAMTQDHALRLEEVFEQMFPQFPGLARVITYRSNYKRSLVEQFKREDLPRIAITVDLLETGVDVPEVVNLVFLRPVQSRIKLEQMIGRGTRSNAACRFPERLPGGRKTEFLVLDFWQNDFNKPASEELAQSLPVLVSLFNSRLKLLNLRNQLSDAGQRIIAELRAMIAQIPLDSFLVKRALPEVRDAWEDSFWQYLSADRLEFLRLKVGPLLRYAPGVDVDAATFANKVERLKLQALGGAPSEETLAAIREDVGRLPSFVADESAAKTAIALCLSPQLPAASPAQLDGVIDALAPQMRHRRDRENSLLTLDLADLVETRGFILLKGGSDPVYIDEYRRRVDQRVLDLIDRHPAIEALAGGAALDDEQLLQLERTLRVELAAGDLELTEENVKRAYGIKVGSLLEFLRQHLDLEGVPDYAEIVQRGFEQYIAAHPFGADQIRFLRALRGVFLRRRRLQAVDFYAPALSPFGVGAAERLFSDVQRAEILSLAESLTVVGA